MAACSNGNPLADAITGFFSFLGDPVGTVIGLIAKSILAAAIAVFAGLADSVPTLDDTTTSNDLSDKTSWIVVYLAVGSLLFAAGKMALERKGTAGVTALKGILRVVLVAGAATTVCLAAARIADSYSTYLFNDSVQNALDNIGACGDNSDIQSFLLLILAFLLLLAGILHTILMYIRLGVMMIMLGTLPLAAAASMTDWGAGWWRKHIGWMISWLLYKPAVALVLNAGMTMISQGKTGTNPNVNTRIAGIGVMLLSAIALPALLKLVVPATAAMGTGDPMAAMGQAGSQLATGAVQVGAMSGGSGGAGGESGQKGPSGASGTGGASGGSGADGASGGSGAGGASGPSGASKGGGGAGKAAGGAGKEAGAALGGPAGIAVLAAVAAAQTASATVSGAVEGGDGDLGNNK
ncbi:hypothetical protein ACFY94_31400 [Streptomyces griseorubiginosus]|uniref:hypothetical protein n=1 Tax=Streptomyces griseorubiginosus TaxID=67304 RepID=UPI0036EF57C9